MPPSSQRLSSAERPHLASPALHPVTGTVYPQTTASKASPFPTMSSHSDNMPKPDGSYFDSIFRFYHLIGLLSSPPTSGHALPRQQRDPGTTPGRFTGKGTMIKSTTGKLVGFIGTVAVSAALVGFAATGTGAYFSDSRSGAVTGATGSIKVVTSGGGGTDG